MPDSPVPTFVLADGSQIKLGRIQPVARPNALQFGAYMEKTRAATPVPPELSWSPKAMASLSRMYMNHILGCCVISSSFHQVGVHTGNDADSISVATDQEVEAVYRIWNPYPADNGCVISYVLDYQRDHGIAMSGRIHKIDGYVSVDWRNIEQVKTALFLFGTLKVGINLPQGWAGQSKVWDVTNTRIVGGHDVLACGYNAQGVQVSSWGNLFMITWAAFVNHTWIKELYAPLSPDWYGNDNLAPCGVDVKTLKEDLAMVGGGGIPPIGPPPVVPPVVVPPPVPYGLTLEQAVAVAQFGLAQGRYPRLRSPLPMANLCVKTALTNSWPKGAL